MPTYAGRPSTMSSTIPVDLPQNSLVGQQTSELQFDKFPNLQSFLVWKIRFKNQVTPCCDFPSDAMLWIKEVEMIDSLEVLKSSRSIERKSRDCSTAHFPIAANARTDEFYAWFWRIPEY